MTKAELERQGRPYFEGVPKLIAQAPSEYPHPATRLSYRHVPIYGTTRPPIRQPSTLLWWTSHNGLSYAVPPLFAVQIREWAKMQR